MKRSFRAVASLLLPIFLTAAAPALAAPRWTPLGPYGGAVWAVVVDPVHSGVLYAVVPRAGVFRSADHGESWTHLDAAPASCSSLAIDPVHPKILYAAGSRVYKSRDSGAHWALAARGLPRSLVGMTLAVDPSNPARIYLATWNQGIWQSRDGGASWRQASLGLPDTAVTGIVVPRGAKGTVFASTALGVYKSLSYGASWAPQGLAGESVSALTVAPSDPRTVYALLSRGAIARSTDGGVSWTWTGLLVPPPNSIYALAVDPRSSRSVYVAADTGLYKSANAGRSWRPIGPNRSTWVTSLAIAPRAPDTVYAGMHDSGFKTGGVLRSPDAGLHWVELRSGLYGLQVATAAIDPADPDLLLVGMFSKGLFRSTDHGRSWSRSPLSIPREFPLVSVQSLAASPETSGAFVATVYPGDLLWKTADGGLTWTRYSDFKNTWGIVLFDPSRADTFYVVNRLGIFRGTMADTSLVHLPAFPPGFAPADLAVVRGSAAALPVFYAAGTVRVDTGTWRSAVLRSTDGGDTWSSAGAGLPGTWVAGLTVDPEDPDVVYARIANEPGISLGLWKTEDGGASWRQVGEELGGQFVVALAALPGRLLAVTAQDTEGTIFLSEDGGESWQEYGTGLGWITGFATSPAAPGRVYAATGLGLCLLEEAEP